jgi:muconolactone delta-isomerase
MLYLIVSTPRPERPSEVAKTRQSFWPWIADYEASGECRHIYARVGRGAVAVFDVDGNDALHRILNEWADIIPAHFDTFPLIDAEAANRMLVAQIAAKKPT